MNKETTLCILRIVLTVLVRTALCAAAVCALAAIGLAMVLNTVFNGPSLTARNQLTLTLLESDRFRDVPGRFLDETTIAEICAPGAAPAGVTNPDLVQPAMGEYAETTVQTDYYTAQIQFHRGQDNSPLIAESLFSAYSESICSHYAGVAPDGILAISDTPEGLYDLGIGYVYECGQVLLVNSQANSALIRGELGRAPYRAIGQCADGTVILISTDGWTAEHPGADCADLITLMMQYGAVNACIVGSGK